MRDEDRDPATIIGWTTAALALTIALLLPVGYFSLKYSALGSAVGTRAEIKAASLMQLVGSAPEMWRFQEHRLTELLHRYSDDRQEESARLLDADGAEVVSVGPNVGFPRLSRSAGLFDSGAPIGRIEVEHSLRGLLLETAGVALLGASLGVVVFLLLRVLARRVQRFNDALHEEKERAEVTLQSIGDAVITTDTIGTVQYLNPVAERLTGWSLDAARGQPARLVLQLIDEETLEPAASPLDRAISGNAICTFGQKVALLRRDGASVAIEDSAAPIRDRTGRVIGGVIVFHDVSASRRMAQRLTWQATHDALTGLVNRREFESRVDAAIASAQDSDKSHVVCYLDLDQFKVVNDTCGHAAGDELLNQLATLLQAEVRQSDILARLGGDEFGLLLDSCSLDRGRVIAEHLIEVVREFRFRWDGKVFPLQVSIGLAAVAKSSSLAELLSAADSALFAAKEQGRNRVCVYHSADVDLVRRRNEMDWVARLNRAMETGRFRLYHQRYLALTGDSHGGLHIEVLLRLLNEDGTLVLPGSFLPAAERYNLMPAIDRWVVEKVFSRYREIAARFGGGRVTCAINLSGSSINSLGFLDWVREQATIHAVPHGGICFEITETAAIHNLRKVAEFMRESKALGFRFSLDDFGAGTSSFGYLKSLPVDYLKIDGGFVKDLMDDPLDRAMTETINRIGHIVGVKTVAEFAENGSIVSELKEMGVDFAQGFGVSESRPLFADGETEHDERLSALPSASPP